MLALGLASLVGTDVGDEKASPRFTVATAAETRAGCALVELADDGTLIVEQAATQLKVSRLTSLRQENQALPPLLTKDFVLLANGDRLPLDPDAAATLKENRLVVWPAKSLGGASTTGLNLYLHHTVLLFWTLPDGVEDADLFFANLQQESRKQDVAHLKNGDRIEGTVTALSAKLGCVITTGNRSVQTPWSRLAGIAWSTERQARLRAKKTYYRAVLQGGGRVNFTELTHEEKSRRWTGKTQFGTTLELPAESILALDVRLGPVVDLGELTPTFYEQRPYLGVSWPLMKDTSITGQPLRLAGSTYEKGLGLHGPCQVSYLLDGQYERFESLVGLDQRRGQRGRLRVAVRLDGKRVDFHEGKEVTASDPPLAIRLDVRDVKEMTLIVDVGAFGDVQAHANWVNARLIKREK